MLYYIRSWLLIHVFYLYRLRSDFSAAQQAQLETTKISSNKNGKVRMEEGSVITDLLLNLQLVCDTTSDLKWTPCRVKFKHTMRNGNFKFRHKD